MAEKKFRIPGLSFSWKRAIGLTSLRQKIARATGIPTTREGRRRKFGPFGLFALAGLFQAADRNTSATTSQSNHSADVGAGCLGCLIVSGILTIGMFALCAGIAFLGSIAAPPPNRQRPPTTALITNQQQLVTEPPKTKRITVSAVPPPLPKELLADDYKLLPNPRESDPPVPPESPKPVRRPVRTWTSADGKFTVEAEFISFGAGVVKLRRVDNGKELHLNEEILSPQDMTWIRSRF